MADTTLGFPYPAGADSPAGHTQIQALATAVDLMPGVGSYTQAQIDTFTVGEKRAGRIVWNSTTGTLQRCDGSVWVDLVLASGAQTLAGKTLTTPTIASMVNANHDHSAGAGGGLLPQSSIVNLVSDLAGAGGLKLITSQAFSAVSAVNVNSCFTSTYDNYLIEVFHTCSGSPNTTLRLRLSGTDASTNYDSRRSDLGGTYATSTSTSAFMLGFMNTGICSSTIHLYRPAIAASTSLHALSNSGSGAQSYIGAGQHTAATAYDGFSLIADSGNITGTVRVYGYKNS